MRDLAAGLAGVSFLLSAAPLQAQAEVHPLQREGAPLANLCASIHFHTEETQATAADNYRYQTLLYAVAGVRAADTDAEIRDKMQRFWAETGQRLTCRTAGFDVPNGNLMKLAIHRRFSDFIDEATEVWQIPLNRVDTADGRTALDYLDDQIRLNLGNAVEPFLRRYREKMRSAGAVNRREIDGIDCTHWPNAARIDQRCPRARP